MIHIEILPAYGAQNGYYRATGHAAEGKEQICTAVTAIEECLAANLENVWNLRLERKAEKGRYTLRWWKSDRQGKGIPRANSAAGFAYTGLRALAKTYPDELKVEWKRPEIEKRRE